MNPILKRLSLLCFLLVVSEKAFAYKEKEDSLTYKKQHFLSFGYSSLFIHPLQTNSELLKSRFTYMPELNLGYTCDLSKFFSLNSRFNFSRNAFSYNYQFDTPLNSVYRQADKPIESVSSNVRENILGYNLNIDLAINFKIQQKENFFSIGFGPRVYTFLRYYINFKYTDSYFINAQNRNQRLFEGELNNDDLSTFQFATNVYLSYYKKLKKGLFLKMSLIQSHSYFRRLEGTYEFSGLGFEEKGSWFQRISFIGASFELMIPTRIPRPGRRSKGS